METLDGTMGMVGIGDIGDYRLAYIDRHMHRKETHLIIGDTFVGRVSIP